MDTPSQRQLISRIVNKDDPLTGLGLLVLANRISETALGIKLDQAATLAATAVRGWFPFTAWCATRGTPANNMPVHLLLPSVYGWLMHTCNEQKDLDRLNRRIFGAVSPW